MGKHKGNVGRVLQFMKTHKRGISSIEAFERFGATRLSSIIFVLRKEYKIESTECEDKNRFGEKVRYVRYKLIEEL